MNYVTLIRIIKKITRDILTRLNTKTILFGNPDFDLLIIDAKADNFSLDRGLDTDVLNEIKTSVKISRLDGTQKEIETLDAILKDSIKNGDLRGAAVDQVGKVNGSSIFASRGFTSSCLLFSCASFFSKIFNLSAEYNNLALKHPPPKSSSCIVM